LHSVSTLLAIALDIHITRMNTLRGSHFRLDLRNSNNNDRKTRNHLPLSNGPYTNINHHHHNHNHHQIESQETLTRHSHENYANNNAAAAFGMSGLGMTGPRQKSRAGYSIPELQFDYETEYQGGHAARVFGAR
jgi:hypothetical protein